MNNKSERRMTVHERRAKHRSAHPRDTRSFGEAQLPKKGKKIKSGFKDVEAKQEITNQQTEPVAKYTKPLIEPPRKQLPSNKRKCRTCGAVENAHRVRIGDCHTERYGKGYYGQTYSGAKGRGRLHGI